jgi:malto-oligosyltrehalose synthase/4-alpha-glucanotransferase
MLPYLHQLGVKTIYASPFFEAASGSTHGYDVINPLRVNPEIGTLEELQEIRKAMTEYKMGWLQDIVPNHMAFDPHNPWLYDVLEKGKRSRYACFFDVMWRGEKDKEYIMVPFLENTPEEAIKKNDFKIEYKNERFALNYKDQLYPLSAHSSEKIRSENHDIKEGLKKYNTPEHIAEILNEQFYRLCHWQETDHRINYRRFFTVNGLICLDSKDEQVFKEYHQFILSLLNDGILDGLRVDHIDGLYDPVAYLKRLRNETGDGTYTIVEKILEPGEDIPAQWPIQGNTGYDFLYFVNNLLTNKKAELPLTSFYHELTNDHRPVAEHLREKKAHILYQHMDGDLKNLTRLFTEQKLVNEETLNALGQDQLKKAIGEFLIECPVYRYYGNKMPLQDKEITAVSAIIKKVKERDQSLTGAMEVLEQVFIHQPKGGDDEYRKKAAHFYLRCMQFTGPLMAKGVEDTLMYTYNRFITHNEVGNSPETFGISPSDFHKEMKQRQKIWPLTLNATSTHDTKRGEDVRARLNTLSDLQEEWMQVVKEWQELNKDLRHDNTPDANDEYFIYQTLAGTYPMPGNDVGDYKDRLLQYLQKAMREAKRRSDWAKPDIAYESGVHQFAEQLLCEGTPFNKSFKAFHEKIVDFGIINSLVQVVLKFTCPGVPDIYQGADLWDLSFVDPDNRRPVDYIRREQLLKEIAEQEKSASFFKDLWKDRYEGKIKLWLIHFLLKLRKEQEDVFTNGDYIPLETEGKYREHVFAFARRYNKVWHIITVPLHPAVIAREQNKAIGDIDWGDTAIILPELPKGFAEQVIAGNKIEYNGKLDVKDLFRDLPVSILRLREPDNERGAGILLHISSLPSLFGIGDMGPEAFAFADFLHRSYQRYWQLLPLNPIEEAQGYSPYSSVSSRAGNILLISPQILAEWGLLDKGELSQYQQKQDGKTNYIEAARVRNILFDKAWNNFKSQKDNSLHDLFTSFCEKEEEWLNDFALYTVLKQHHGKAWYEWPEPYKLRQSDALEKFADEQQEEVEKVKWLQFIFNRQWQQLRDYCKSVHIRLVGDLSFYVSYDSADVWSHRDIFNLDENGNIKGIAGVGPDSVSDDGQLWGMPVYNWEVLKSKKYEWWIERFRRNKELFDLVRIDHFRAFATYYEVPAGESTARNGKWKQGPGNDFFKVVKEQLGDLPFIVEDLGEADKATFRLRDEFELPGMKVLHFAFDENMPSNPYAPHHHSTNFWAYTGTHDNNTTRGWYRQEGKDYHQNLEEYTGRKVTDDDVHIILSRMAHASVAKTVILPVQDVLGLDEIARMNMPASLMNNWQWRLLPGQLNNAAEEQLRKWTELFDRKK